MKEKTLLYIISILSCATFFTALIYSTKFVFPFIVPKALFFRSISLIIFGFFVLLCLKKKSYLRQVNPVSLAVLFFLVSLFFSTILGVDWYKSFWDNQERMLGVFTITHYIIFFFVLSHTFESWGSWKKLLRVFLGVGSLVMIVGCWQYFVDSDFLLNQGSSRVSATLGNAIYFSGFGLFLLYVGLLLFFKEPHRFWRVFAAFGALLGCSGIFLGGTRGTFVGLFFSLSFCLGYFFWKYKNNKKVSRTIISTLLAFFLVFVFFFVFRDSELVARVPGISRLLNTSFESGGAGTRLMAWGIAYEAFKEYPLFGWGPNNYYYAFNLFYRPEFILYGLGETWFDNAHSTLFNTLAVRGILGVVSYIALFFFPIQALWKKRLDFKEDIFPVLTIAFLVGHFVHNIFVFENITSYLYFFFTLAMVSSLCFNQKDMRVFKAKEVSLALMLIVLGSCFVIVHYTSFLPGRANRLSARALRALYQKNSLLFAESVVAYPTHNIVDIRNDLVNAILDRIPILFRESKLGVAKNFLDFAKREVEKNMTIHKKDVRLMTSYAQIVAFQGALSNDPAYLQEAKKILQEALGYSPKRQQLFFILARAHQNLGENEQALERIKDAVYLEPREEESWWHYIVLLNEQNKIEDVRRVVLEAESFGVVFNQKRRNLIDQILIQI